MLPAIVSQCVVGLKDTALGYIIIYPELLRDRPADLQRVLQHHPDRRTSSRPSTWR